ncbi:hypothetical protein [Aurantimonas endophytica]|uniref:Uncharacterized protein n=1 Tax=Aurantimonas endophytica TaxID=1522175 RepID=A0A7W6HGB3_9HYPH|nr:hypothetical protein [Aurantimonas endophytica]MBB4004628.1 hypothetical protein [Aurantimonas endophytica]MCO6405460.1 hypothetical protein [Aurantimonas endophytica]
MSSKDTLPAAVDFPDRRSLSDLDEARLTTLWEDCGAWCIWMQEFRAGFSTQAGETEWQVLTRHEHEDVAAAHARIEDEIAAQKSL